MSTLVYQQTMKSEQEQTDQWLQFPTPHMTQKIQKRGQETKRGQRTKII